MRHRRLRALRLRNPDLGDRDRCVPGPSVPGPGLRALGLGLAATLALLSPPPARAEAVLAELDHVGTYIWTGDAPSFGGFSGIELSADGSRFHALTDRAHLYRGRVLRDAQGRISGMAVDGWSHLRDSRGVPLPPGYKGDSEGLAIGPDGRIWVSFEGLVRVAGYDDPEASAATLPFPPKLPGMGVNAGLEALAIHPDGVIHAILERSASEAEPFTVLTHDTTRGTEPVGGDAWGQDLRIRRDPRWLAVGADFGPDGWFYLLERDFHGIFGFASRVRRMRLTPEGPQDEQILLRTRPLQYDNLEGISVWHDGTHIRLTMISDDNFLFLQRTEIVEYRLRETELQADLWN